MHQVGDADSKVTSRQISMQEIKVELLSELGTYIQSRIDITQGNKTDTEFKEEIIALTSGFVRVDMIEERFNGDTYYLKAKLVADPAEVISRINEMGSATKAHQQDKQKLIAAYQESKALRAQLAKLQRELEIAKAADKNTAEIESAYAKEAEQLSANELAETGDDYNFGRKDITIDYVRAVEFYKRAAAMGHIRAQYNLGWMYENGRGVTEDDKLAVDWFRKAAEQGYARAQYYLGVMYANGIGVTEDDKLAVDWYRKTAEQGVGPAQINLGSMYADGRGVTKNEKLAVDWYRKAAEKGYAAAQFGLGIMYADGRGVTKNEKLAVDWYRKAAEQGYAQAQYNLGRMYAYGEGVSKDDKLAVDWFRKATEQGFEPAQKALETLGVKN
jgi:TPR repeat protein